MTTMDETCWSCGGAGGRHDCGEDTCCCLNADDDEGESWQDCDVCGGAGVVPQVAEP